MFSHSKSALMPALECVHRAKLLIESFESHEDYSPVDEKFRLVYRLDQALREAMMAIIHVRRHYDQYFEQNPAQRPDWYTIPIAYGMDEKRID